MKNPYQESDAYDFHCVPFQKILTFNASEPLRVVLSQPNAQWTKFELRNIAIYPNAYSYTKDAASPTKYTPMDGVSGSSNIASRATKGGTGISMHELIEYDVKVLKNVLNMNQQVEANVHVDEGDEDEEEYE